MKPASHHGPRQPARTVPARLGISILAGGRSSRMGRDKAALRLGGRSLLWTIRRLALGMGWGVRVIRRDLLPGCGPLGGVQAALRTSRADAELFLACDMPFVTLRLLRRLAASLGSGRTGRGAVFTWAAERVGFPFVVRRSMLPVVERELAAGRLSLQGMAGVLKARLLRVGPAQRGQLFNVNTPADWAEARKAGPPRGRLDRSGVRRRKKAKLVLHGP